MRLKDNSKNIEDLDLDFFYSLDFSGLKEVLFSVWFNYEKFKEKKINVCF